MSYYKKLEGSRIYLSPINVEDYPIYTRWINDLSTSIPIGHASSLYSSIKEKSALESMAKGDTSFAIVLSEADELLGNISLMDVNHIHRTAEIGLFIGELDKRGKGYGSEAMMLLISYGFNILNLNNIMLKVFSFNDRGMKTYRQLGFREIGKRTEAFYMNDSYFDEVYMEILRRDFKDEYLKRHLPKKE